jgi:hypothetical protein
VRAIVHRKSPLPSIVPSNTIVGERIECSQRHGTRSLACPDTLLRRVGPPRAGDLVLSASVERTAAENEKALIILECEEAFENTELSPLNRQSSLAGATGELLNNESL